MSPLLRILLLLGVAIFATAMRTPKFYDPNSSANTDQVVATFYDLHVYVDFKNQVLDGFVDITAKVTAQATKEFILDISELSIFSVRVSNTNLKWYITEKALHITMPPGVNAEDTLNFRIFFQTAQTSASLTWMTPEMTKGGKYPYVFSQNEATYARAMFPCQDTPVIKTPYNATIAVENPMKAVMSAHAAGVHQHSDHSEYIWTQPMPVPIYLVALAAGNLVSADTSDRTRVWSEPEMIDDVKWEFAELDSYLSAVENIAGPYQWGRYDILVLPPSFPFGGMENPCLTFATPTLLAGDRSLVNVAIHEIAHWSGNLVSPINWEHFWVNEGFTVFLEARGVNATVKDGVPIQVTSLKNIIGNNELREDIENFKAIDRMDLTRLQPDLSSTEPEDSFSTVPYYKGSQLLWHVQEAVGGVEEMNGFLRTYFDHFKRQSIQTEDMLEFLYEYFHNKHAALDKIDWKEWLFGTGMPPLPHPFDTTLYDQANAIAQEWLEHGDSDADIDSLTVDQKIVFLDIIRLSGKVFGKAFHDRLYAKFTSIHNTKNFEWLFRWHHVALRSCWEDQYADVEAFLGTNGRLKFIKPLYTAYYQCAPDAAVALYKKLKSSYSVIAQNALDKVLHLA